VDSTATNAAWANSLGVENIPLLSDFWPHGQVAQRYGVLREHGFTERAIFVVDKKGVIRYIDIHDIDEQPDNEALLDVLHGLD
jgi:peroxiredoxin